MQAFVIIDAADNAAMKLPTGINGRFARAPESHGWSAHVSPQSSPLDLNGRHRDSNADCRRSRSSSSHCQKGAFISARRTDATLSDRAVCITEQRAIRG
jgi:hypothetical protein